MIPKQNKYGRKLNKDAGSAMIVALVVCVVIMTMCLTLLLVTYTLFAQTSRQNVQMQCKIIAQSFAESFEKEIEDPNSDLVKYLNELMDSHIAQKRWQAIDADENNDPYYYNYAMTNLILAVEDVEGYVIRIEATYELTEEDDDSEDEMPLPDPDPSEKKKSGPMAEFLITCQRGEVGDRDADSYTVICHYNIPPVE